MDKDTNFSPTTQITPPSPIEEFFEKCATFLYDKTQNLSIDPLTAKQVFTSLKQEVDNCNNSDELFDKLNDVGKKFPELETIITDFQQSYKDEKEKQDLIKTLHSTTETTPV
jgi:hypothetical protein